MSNNDETIQLVIDAKNLSAKELSKATTDVDNLGAAATKADKDLEKLEFNKEQINTFKDMKHETDEVSAAYRKMKVKHDELVASTGKLTAGMDKQRLKIEESKDALNDQKRVVNDQKRAYKALAKEVGEFGLHTKNATEIQDELNAKIIEAKGNIKAKADAIERATKKQKHLTAVDEKATKALEEQSDATEKLLKKKKKSARESERQADADEKTAIEAARVTAELKKYEIALVELNKAKNKGKISNGQFIRSEEKLRKELKLTASQAAATRAAVKSDLSTDAKKSKSTDLLTTATRRLAQAYTVLLAAQKATEAVGSSVKGYGDLEAAITKVEKTTGIARDQVVGMSEELRTMAEEITPTATNELLRYAEVAGQMGVDSSESIMKIVSAADALAVSTDLAGDEAALLSARILGMTGEGVDEIHNFASALVELGNSTKTSESEIAHMTKEIVTGTTAMNFSSAAAAGFGATLKELGQPAERSRSAMQDLSNTILDLANEGGEGLEKLSKITGLTADAIEAGLGKEPEQVVIRFIEGLKGAKEAGVTLKTSLAGVGITSKETNAVVGALAGNTERLSEVVGFANTAYADGTAHIKEASKAYADQNSTIARLTNKFTSLKAKIGEAYAPTVISAVDAFSGAMDNNESAVISLMEMLPELVLGVGEVIDSFDDLLAVFGGLGQTLDNLSNAFKKTLNEITIGIRGLGLAVNEIKIFFAEMAGASKESLAEMEKASADIAANITEDLRDIEDANNRFAGKSSIAYEQFIDVVGKSKDAISSLSEEQRAEIEVLSQSNDQKGKAADYNKDAEDSYRKLKAVIGRANLQLEIEAKLAANVIAKRKEAKIAVEEQIAVEEKAIETTITSNRLNESWIEVNGERISVSDLLTQQTAKQTAATLAQADSLVLANGYILKGSELTQYLAEVMGTAAEKTELYTTASNEMELGVRKLQVEIDKLKSTQRDKNEADEAQIEITRKINALTEEQTKLSADLALQRELEGSTLQQLTTIQREHNFELALLEQRWASGTLTYAEYEAAKSEAAFKTKTLTELLGESASGFSNEADAADKAAGAIRNKSAASRDNTESLDEQSAALQKNAGHAGASNALANRWLILQKQLTKSYDYSKLSVEDLSLEMSKLNREYQDNRIAMASATHDLIGVMKPLDDMTNAVNRHKVETLEQTKALQKWIVDIDSGNVSMRGLGEAARQADQYFSKLSDNQLAPLRQAIENARQEFAALSDEINDTFNDTQDRLDRLLGNESDILARKFKAEMQEMQELLEKATESGNAALVRQIKAAMANLRKAQSIEGKELNVRNANSNSSNQQDNSFGSKHRQNNSSVTVNLKLPTGSTTSVAVASSSDADALVSALTQLGEININGVN